MTLTTLPPELLFEIVRFLTPVDLCKLSRTNWFFHDLCGADHFWQPFVTHLEGGLPSDPEDTSAKDMYRRLIPFVFGNVSGHKVSEDGRVLTKTMDTCYMVPIGPPMDNALLYTFILRIEQVEGGLSIGASNNLKVTDWFLSSTPPFRLRPDWERAGFIYGQHKAGDYLCLVVDMPQWKITKGFTYLDAWCPISGNGCRTPVRDHPLQAGIGFSTPGMVIRLLGVTARKSGSPNLDNLKRWQPLPTPR